MQFLCQNLGEGGGGGKESLPAGHRPAYKSLATAQVDLLLHFLRCCWADGYSVVLKQDFYQIAPMRKSEKVPLSQAKRHEGRDSLCHNLEDGHQENREILIFHVQTPGAAC